MRPDTPIQKNTWYPRATLLWFGLLAALSPVLLDLLRHLFREPWASYGLVFPLLFLFVAYTEEKEPSRHPGAGIALIVIGVSLSLAGSMGSEELIRFARPGIPIAVVGLALFLGRPSLEAALLSCWMIPPPHFVLEVVSPTLEATLLQGATLMLRGLGFAVTRTGNVLELPGAELALSAEHSGLLLMVLLAGLGWYAALRRAGGMLDCVRSAALWGVLGIPAQYLGLSLAGLIAALGAVEVAKALLSYAWWMTVAAAAIAFAEHQRRKWNP